MKNEETQNIISIDMEKCTGCLKCAKACMEDLINPTGKFSKTGYKIVKFTNNGKCTACTLCALVCPEAAIEVHAKHILINLATAQS